MARAAVETPPLPRPLTTTRGGGGRAQPGDVYFCTADCGWITGHSYVTYGPLLNRATQVRFGLTSRRLTRGHLTRGHFDQRP